MTLGEKIKDYRRENRLSMEEFGQRIGTTRAFVNQLEKGNDGRGKRPHPTIERMTKIANAMGMSLTELIDSVDDYGNNPENVDYAAAAAESIVDSIDGSTLYCMDNKTNELGSMMMFLSRLTPYQINKLHRIGEIIFTEKESSTKKPAAEEVPEE